MAKRKRVVRLFFNTFYEDAAKAILERLERSYGRVRVVRSQVLPEFYYVEIQVGENEDPARVRTEVENLVAQVGGDRVFGVKAYDVQT